MRFDFSLWDSNLENEIANLPVRLAISLWDWHSPCEIRISKMRLPISLWDWISLDSTKFIGYSGNPVITSIFVSPVGAVITGVHYIWKLKYSSKNIVVDQKRQNLRKKTYFSWRRRLIWSNFLRIGNLVRNQHSNLTPSMYK